ncbi:MAG: hypothetical protein K2X93_13965 [Candidatus Obscuribacterales bacterium]|nr:hypothetical protein [Candidatus Obscuribacterales bacterium]
MPAQTAGTIELEHARATVLVAAVLKQRVGADTPSAAVATRLVLAASRAQRDGGARGLGVAAGASTGTSVCRQRNGLAGVTGHLCYLWIVV